MTHNHLTDEGKAKRLLAWVEQEWDMPPVTQAEKIDGAASQVQRLRTDDGSTRFLKRMDSEEQIRRLALVQDALLLQDVCITPFLPTGKGHRFGTFEGEPYVLSKGLEGEAVSAPALERGYSYGRGLAKLHQALATIPWQGQYPVMDLAGQLADWALPQTVKLARVADPCGSSTAFSAFADKMTSTGLLLIRELSCQLIHRDAHPGNMLYQRDGQMGFLDFDLSVAGPRLFDLCYLCTSQWTSAYAVLQSRERWLEQIGQFHKGYAIGAPLTEIEKKAAFYVMCAIQLIFSAFWQDQGREELAQVSLAALLALLPLHDEIDAVFGFCPNSEGHG